MGSEVKYTHDELQKAYVAWVNAKQQDRNRLWNVYCDIRDGVAVGTNQARYDDHINRMNDRLRGMGYVPRFE